MLVKVPAFSPGEGGRHQEHFGLDVLGAALALADDLPVAPEAGRFRLGHVAHHHPFEIGKTALDQPRVAAADDDILAEEEHPPDGVLAHRQGHRQLRMVADDLRQPVIAPVVGRGGALAVPGLQQAHRVFGKVVPPAGRRGLGLQVVPEGAVRLLGVRLRQICREHVVECRDVGAALDAAMASQREDAAARTAGVPEQALDDARGADHLHADRVVGPGDGVAEGAGPLPP